MGIDSVNEAAVAAVYMSGRRPQRARPEARVRTVRGRRQRRGLDSVRGVETAAVAVSEAAAPTSTAAVARDTLESYVVLDTGVSAEWSGSEGGPPAEVELRLHPERTPHATTPSPPPHIRRRAYLTDFNITQADGGDDTNSTGGSGGAGSGGSGGGAVVVRAEEALIVAFVLLLWVAAIALFFNRWGKIRMLEPYQPKFQQQQHRASCPAESIGASVGVGVTPGLSTHHRPSLSRGCGSCGDYAFGGSGPTFQQCSGYQPPPCPAAAAAAVYLAHRPRQNSVFVGSTGAMALIPESPARRSRSAADLRALLQPPHARRTPAVSPHASVSSAHYLTVTDV